MTTLLRRLAERAVRAAAPEPVGDGIDLVDDESTVEKPTPLDGPRRSQEAVAAPSASPRPTTARTSRVPAAAAEVEPRRTAEDAAAIPEHPAAVAAPCTAAVVVPPTGPANAVSAAAPAPAATVGVPAPDLAPAPAVVPAVPIVGPLWRAGVTSRGARHDDPGVPVDEAGPTVQVRIGRLDVRAVAPAPAPPATRRDRDHDSATELELSDYLRGKRVPR